MKFVLFLAAFISISVPALAQQVPTSGAIEGTKMIGGAPFDPDRKEAPGGLSADSNKDLVNLLQAQTTAIKDLSDKINGLEKRIDKLEKGKR